MEKKYDCHTCFDKGWIGSRGNPVTGEPKTIKECPEHCEASKRVYGRA